MQLLWAAASAVWLQSDINRNKLSQKYGGNIFANEANEGGITRFRYSPHAQCLRRQASK